MIIGRRNQINRRRLLEEERRQRRQRQQQQQQQQQQQEAESQTREFLVPMPVNSIIIIVIAAR